ncbi:MAG: acetylxylan esterase [Planctomycetota bacterium]
MRITRLFLALLVATASVARADRQLKEYDNDINYDESKIPYYDLPPLLLSAEGDEVTTPDEWRNVRRPQIMSLFSNLVYGRVPQLESPLETEYRVVSTDEQYLDGAATHKEVLLEFSNANGKVSITAHVVIPNDVAKPVPAFMKIGSGPVEEILERGFAAIGVDHNDFVGHNEVSFERSIHRLFFQKGQSFPKARQWGVLSAIAWGHSRVLDYLEIDDDVDAARVAIMGHSKNGKAALWTAAQDERFALAISAQSGCAGAALWRRRSGETLQKMVTRFPYWLCRNAWKFVNQEDDLPVDQHMLLALIAPRPVYVASGSDDTWADPRGEHASAYHASAVYELLGKKGLTSAELPPSGEAILDSDVGYHIRDGGHSVDPYDWRMFLDFCERHLPR